MLDDDEIHTKIYTNLQVVISMLHLLHNNKSSTKITKALFHKIACLSITLTYYSHTLSQGGRDQPQMQESTRMHMQRASIFSVADIFLEMLTPCCSQICMLVPYQGVCYHLAEVVSGKTQVSQFCKCNQSEVNSIGQ